MALIIGCKNDANGLFFCAVHMTVMMVTALVSECLPRYSVSGRNMKDVT